VSNPELPKQRQPDIIGDSASVTTPSLWLYISLIAIAIILVLISFSARVDWPGLMLNLASSLISAVIVLVVVDRRLRASELNHIRSFPRRFGYRVLLIVPTRHRQLHRYTQTFLSALQSKLASKVVPSDIEQLAQNTGKGFVLLARAGTGKTTRLQMLAQRWARKFVEDPNTKVPILFPLRQWLPERSIEEALFEHINRFAPVGQKSFRQTLKTGQAIVILDGADETFMKASPKFSHEFPRLRADYPDVTWILSSSANTPAPVDDLPLVNLPELSPEELQQVRRESDAD
jgi:hypothetical protein